MRGFGNGRMDRLTDRRTFAIVELLSQLKRDVTGQSSLGLIQFLDASASLEAGVSVTRYLVQILMISYILN